jgi:hypothetical protein
MQLHCQIQAPAENILTPLGITKKSNIHYVAHNQYVNINRNEIQIVKNQSNSIFKNVNASKDGTVINDNFKNGWTTWADGHIYDYFPSSPTYFKATYIVPPNPKDNHQLIYIFNGLGAIDSGISHIVQPVLQWGHSPAGGGNYWAICNWYVNNNQFFYDSLVRVNPGDTLQGLIEMTASYNNKAEYFSSFLGYKSGLRITNLPKLESLYVVLETFNANCDDLPKNEKIKIQEIRVRSDIENPTLLWNKYDNNACGQYSTIVDQSSTNGEIHLNFHSPFSFDDFDEVHIYPNPIRDYLHISPNGIKNVLGYRNDIQDCTIQIFDSAGKLIYSDFYPELTDEIDLDFSNFRTGIFFIRFLYNNKDHTFKIIKI